MPILYDPIYSWDLGNALDAKAHYQVWLARRIAASLYPQSDTGTAMNMSPRFYLWLQSLAQRDQFFMELTGLALMIVLAWLGTDYLPTWIRPWLRKVYLIGGIGLYIITIILTVEVQK